MKHKQNKLTGTRWAFLFLIVTCCLSRLAWGTAADWPRPEDLPDDLLFGRNISRSMALISGSVREKRNTVRVLFYGQSITALWSHKMEEYLRKTYPFVNFVFGHLAIGGFEAQNLVKIAPTDINAFYPDLMIFHDYTKDPKPYEEIIRQALEHTTTDILILNDHVIKKEEIDENPGSQDQTDLGLYARHNLVFLPDLARRYHIEFGDIRTPWKRYLKTNHLPPQALLKDVVHLNEQGVFVMTELIKRHLRFAPGNAEEKEWEKKVRTYPVGEGLKWINNRMDLEFEGNRVDLIAGNGVASNGTVQVLIDGKRPSSLPGTTAFARTSAYPGSWWPALPRISSRVPLVPEDWSLEIFEASDDLTTFKFRVEGSLTGPDGAGNSAEPFVSNSGRVVIAPEDWDRLVFARKMTKLPLPAGFKITWKAVPFFIDDYLQPKFFNPVVETATTVAQGFPNGRHHLTLVVPKGARPPLLKAIRIYHPEVFQ